MYAFITSDYSLNIVLNHSHESKPLIYKLSGLWANHEGSMLLWIWIFSLFNIIFLYYNSFSQINAAKILSLQSLILLTFLVFIIITSNPFLPSQEYFPTGKGLNPLLQDLGLLIHPPTLYLGFVNFSLGFSAAIIALLNGTTPNKWFTDLKPWIMTPWVCLTCGIGLGSWWAYRELGWGGFWFWDPVENASLLPWLSATALIHSVRIASIKGSLKLWSLFLSIITFILTIFGTFLVRSGIVTSVHSFALDATKGTVIFAILIFIILISLIIFYWRKSTIKSTYINNLFSKDGGILLNNILLISLASAILIGILYPIFYEYFYHTSISINENYYVTITKIIILPLIILISIFAFLKWDNDHIKTYIKPWSYIFIISILFTGITYLYKPFSIFSFIILTFAFFLLTSLCFNFIKKLISKTLYSPNTIAMLLSHMGLALIIIAITLNQNWQQENSVMMKIDTTTNFANYKIKLDAINYNKNSNFLSREAKVIIYNHNNIELTTLYPETRFYPVENVFTTESAVHHSLTTDLYITIGEILPGNRVMVNLQYKPFIMWIWASIIFMVSGGLISLTKNRMKP
jgi:cytochrome c-type biogenesis protein CcmF